MGHDITDCGSDKTIYGGETLIELFVGQGNPPAGNPFHVATRGGEHLTMAQWLTLRASAADTQVSTADWADQLEAKSPEWFGRVMSTVASRGLVQAAVKQLLRTHAARYHGFNYPAP